VHGAAMKNLSVRWWMNGRIGIIMFYILYNVNLALRV
jgi:hypothetical protein